ncbi:hypothetical protein BY458DRAFT_507721 [Sporodiniella umbellata]|nr:hypothetical protein BY458DRAFT_507721 [Sporodiniella umbellata]
MALNWCINRLLIETYTFHTGFIYLYFIFLSSLQYFSIRVVSDFFLLKTILIYLYQLSYTSGQAFF